jgi:hypothetical protein
MISSLPRRTPMRFLAYPIFLLALSSCAVEVSGTGNTTGSGDFTVDYIDQDIQGTFENTDVTFGAGKFSQSVGDDTTYTVVIYDNTVTDACNTSQTFASEYLVIFTTTAVGTYDLSLTGDDVQTVTFAENNENFIITEGQLQIETLTASELTGRMHVNYSGDIELNGNFSVQTCD